MCVINKTQQFGTEGHGHARPARGWMPDAARKSVADAQPRTPVIAPDTRAHSVALVCFPRGNFGRGKKPRIPSKEEEEHVFWV